MNIDYNRGVTKRITQAGVEIFMYQDEPGVFRNAFGDTVAVGLAEEAGYNVSHFGQIRAKNLRLAEAHAAIESEFQSSETERCILQEINGYQLVSIGLGRHEVLDPEGSKLSANPLTRQEADVLIKAMIPNAEDEDAPTTEVTAEPE